MSALFTLLSLAAAAGVWNYAPMLWAGGFLDELPFLAPMLAAFGVLSLGDYLERRWRAKH